MMTNTTNTTNTAAKTAGAAKKKSGLGTWIVLIIAAVIIWNFVQSRDSIEGMWQAVGVETSYGYETPTAEEMVTFSFNKDGSGYVTGEGEGYPFNYSYENGNLILIAGGGSTYATCEIKGDRMTLTANGTTVNLKRM